MKTPFLSIPKWREMHLLHGLLIYIALVLSVTWLVGFVVFPEARELIRFTLYLTWLWFTPVFLAFYYAISSNRHLSRP